MYADENGSTKSALFFESLPACQKPPQEFFDTLHRAVKLPDLKAAKAYDFTNLSYVFTMQIPKKLL